MNGVWLVVVLLAAPPAFDDGRALAAAPARPAQPAASFRRLVDAVALDDGRQLAVAGQRSGAIAIVDVAGGTITQEIAVGERLEALAVGVAVPVTSAPVTSAPVTTERGAAERNATERNTTERGAAASAAASRTMLAAVDSARDELSLLSMDGAGRWRVTRRIAVVRSPVSVCLARSGRVATVAGLWSHRWQVVTLDDNAGRVRATNADTQSSVVELPFAPRLQVELPDGRFLVTDAFGGQFALLEASPARLVAVAQWPIHNIRALSVSPDGQSVVLAHQELNERLPIRREAILDGRLIRNGLSHVSIGGQLTTRRFESLDELPNAASSSLLSAAKETAARGAGDPAGIAWLGKRRVVALAGLSECLSSSVEDSGPSPAEGSERSSPRASAEGPQRFATGARPLRVIALPLAGRVAVVGALDDSITFIDPLGRAAPRRVMLSPHASPTPQDRGERAFFDARLSAGGFLSCHSCHSDAHTNGLLSDTLGDDTDGAPKRVPTLLGTGMTYRWGWNGAQQSLHDQVLKSIDQTMGGQPRFQDGTDMVAFFHTLAPPPPLEPVAPAAAAHTAAAAERRLVEQGRALFTDRGCANCHLPPLVYASHESYDVGLSDERGLRKFNPPSLRGVSQAGRWLHDGRAGSLEAVFRDHAHPNDTRWAETELPALLRFLRSL
jgi:hypothetical protein